MNFLERMAEGAHANGMAMAAEALDLLRQIRDQTGEGTAAREVSFARPFGVPIVGGGGIATWNLPAGVAVQLSSLAVTLPGTGGRVAVYAGGVSPGSLLRVLDIPAAAIAGTVAATGIFGPEDYAPEMGTLTILVEGNTGADGTTATVVLRGKQYVRGDAMDVGPRGA